MKDAEKVIKRDPDLSSYSKYEEESKKPKEEPKEEPVEEKTISKVVPPPSSNSNSSG